MKTLIKYCLLTNFLFFYCGSNKFSRYKAYENKQESSIQYLGGESDIPVITWYEHFIAKPYKKIKISQTPRHSQYDNRINGFWGEYENDENEELIPLNYNEEGYDDEDWVWNDDEIYSIEKKDNRSLQDVLLDKIYSKSYCCQEVTYINLDNDGVIEVNLQKEVIYDSAHESNCDIIDLELSLACIEQVKLDIHSAIKGYSSMRTKSLFFHDNNSYSSLPAGLVDITKVIFSQIKKTFIQKGYLKADDKTNLVIFHNDYISSDITSSNDKLLFIHFNYNTGNVEISSNLIRGCFLFIMEKYSDLIYQYYLRIDEVESKNEQYEFYETLYNPYTQYKKEQQIATINKGFKKLFSDAFYTDYYNSLKFVFGHEISHRLNIFDEEEADCLSFKVLGEPREVCVFSKIINESLKQGLEDYWGFELSDKQSLIDRANRLDQIVAKNIICD